MFRAFSQKFEVKNLAGLSTTICCFYLSIQVKKVELAFVRHGSIVPCRLKVFMYLWQTPSKSFSFLLSLASRGSSWSCLGCSKVLPF